MIGNDWAFWFLWYVMIFIGLSFLIRVALIMEGEYPRRETKHMSYDVGMAILGGLEIVFCALALYFLP